MSRLLLLLCSLPWLAQAQTISFSFDDGLNPETQPKAASWNAQILETLKQTAVHAAFFPAGKNIDTPAGMVLVQAWSDAGHSVGNHTYSHRNLNSSKLTLEAFCADILAAEKLLKPLQNWQPRLRFPYLKEGDTAEKRDGMRRWMQDHGYQPAPVSIDASDWYYSQRFEAWQKSHPDQDPEPFRQAYLRHLLNRAEYYEGLAQQVLGRSPAHVILLHTNAINAAMLADVIAMFRAKGWQIVDTKEAFNDPLYSMQSQILPAGESMLWALAKQAGDKSLRYPAEDSIYEEGLLDALKL